MPKFRKKPVVINAMEILSHGQIIDAPWAHEALVKRDLIWDGRCFTINTREGTLKGYPGDYLIQGVQGEIYPCGREIFNQTYDPVFKHPSEDPPNLFMNGWFESSSGKRLDWKVECDALTDEDIECIASRIGATYVFSKVVPVLTGGARLAKALENHCLHSSDNILVVDDVLTTGRSIKRVMKRTRNKYKTKEVFGVVIFDRSFEPLPPDVDALWMIGF